jgi:hypothetical protein
MNLLKNIKKLATDSTGSSGPTQNWYIVAERAEGLKDKDVMSKSDPYLKVTFGGKSVHTRTIKDDRSPCWNETFCFKLTPDQVKDLEICLKDDDFGLDDAIGKARISRSELPSFSGEEKYLKVPVYSNEQVTGVIHLRVKLMSDGQPVSQSSNISYTQQQQTQSHPQQPYNMQQQQSTYPQGVPMNSTLQAATHPQQQPYSNQPQSNTNYYGRR